MSFNRQVWAVARAIPYGRVTNYGAIADFIGGGSARQVGWAMHQAITADPPVPAHRVVNRNGVLTGKLHFGSPTMMQQLLENEGLTIIDDKIQDFKVHFWNPSTALPMDFLSL